MIDQLNDQQLLRYSRHILLPQVDVEGQQRICRSRIAVVGLGGLGSPAALYLAAAGVSELVLIDDDSVELANLQRQIIHSEATLGWSKTASARQLLQGINGDITIQVVNERLTEATVATVLACAHVVVDCSDNFTTRNLLNHFCWQRKIPLVSGAAIGFEGQLTVFDANRPHSPCYSCLYELDAEQPLSCAENGVLGPVVGVIGAAQALEALKLVGRFGQPLIGRVQLFDALNGLFREFKLKPDPDCSVCRLR